MSGPADVDGGVPDRFEDGGDAACWAHLVCPECGAVEIEGHRPECRLADGASVVTAEPPRATDARQRR